MFLKGVVVNVLQKTAGIIVAFGLTAGAVVLSGLPSAASEPQRPLSTSQDASTTMTLIQTADALASVGATTEFASSFGGVEFNAAGDGLIVRLINPTLSLESALLQAASADPTLVTFEPAPRTYSSVTEQNDLVTSRFGSLSAEGIDIRSSGIGPGPQVVISVRGLTSAIADQIHQEFGNDVLVTEAGPDATATVFDSYTTPRPRLWNLSLF